MQAAQESDTNLRLHSNQPESRTLRPLTVTVSSRQQFADNMAMHIGQPELAARVEMGQPLVVDAELMQDRRLQVMHVDRLIDDMEPKVIGRSIAEAPLHPAAGQPHRVRLRMMIATEASAECGIVLDHRRASELATPDDERLVEQAASLEVRHQRSRCLITCHSCS